MISRGRRRILGMNPWRRRLELMNPRASAKKRAQHGRATEQQNFHFVKIGNERPCVRRSLLRNHGFPNRASVKKPDPS
jgi:hypothetical protein